MGLVPLLESPVQGLGELLLLAMLQETAQD